MTPARAHSLITAIWLRALAARFQGTASQWCEQKIQFREPGRVGQFSFRGREYLRKPLDGYGEDDVTDQVICFGTRTGKTTIMFAGAAYRLFEKARRALFVHPASKGPAGADSVARTRFIPMLRASECLNELIPTGALRHNFKTAQQMLKNGSIADWVGSNSVGQLASNSMEDVYLDEVDKFNMTRRRDEHGNEVEADACQLAFERTGEYRNPKRIQASTPTLEAGRIWSQLLATDLQRRFVPCPLCGRDHPSSRLVCLIWSDRYTVLPRTFGYGTPREPGSDIPLAQVQWDKEAKRIDGSWDFERIEKSAGYLCPHCKGRFRDDDKIWMDENGVWIPTQRGPPKTHGFHLPSMYANHDQTTAGKMAVEFLKATASIEGPRNFINSKLAEPFCMQGVNVNRVGKVAQHVEVTGQWIKILSIDYQQNAPYLWGMVRAWNGSDACDGIAYRAMHQWSEVDDLQAEFKIIPEAVCVDTGFQHQDVLKECANLQMPNRCKLAESIQGQLPEVVGWTPMKSFGGKNPFKDQATGLWLPYRMKKDQDPFPGSELAKQCRIELLEFRNDIFEDMLENIRSGKTGLSWTIVPEVNTEEYHRHMAGTVRVSERGDPRAYKWRKRDTRWPDHIKKCEIMNLVMAYRLQLISFAAIQTVNTEKEKEAVVAV